MKYFATLLIQAHKEHALDNYIPFTNAEVPVFAPSYKHCFSFSRLIRSTTKRELVDLQNESVGRPKYSITIRRSLLRR